MNNINNITDFLQTNFGLGKDSPLFANFTKECLSLPLYSNKTGILKPENSYKNPTPYDFGHFKEITGLTTGQICKRLGMDSRELSHFISQKSYEKGNSIPSSIWCQLIEAAGLSERLTLPSRLVDVRDEVLLTSQTLPTKHELFLLISISDFTLEEVAEKISIELDELKANTYKGSTAYDRKMNYIKPDLKNNLSHIHTQDVSLSIKQWLEIRELLGIKGISFIKSPPALRNSCLSTDMSIYMPSPYKDKRKSFLFPDAVTGIRCIGRLLSDRYVLILCVFRAHINSDVFYRRNLGGQ